MARPTKYTNELAENFCLEIIEGKSVREICNDKSYPCMATIFNWLNTNNSLLEQYEKAKEIQADVMAEDMLSIADNQEGDVQRDRLRIDTRKWIASKLKPKKYGQSTQVEIKKKAKYKYTTEDIHSLSSDELDEIIGLPFSKIIEKLSDEELNNLIEHKQ